MQEQRNKYVGYSMLPCVKGSQRCAMLVTWIGWKVSFSNWEITDYNPPKVGVMVAILSGSNAHSSRNCSLAKPIFHQKTAFFPSQTLKRATTCPQPTFYFSLGPTESNLCNKKQCTRSSKKLILYEKEPSGNVWMLECWNNKQTNKQMQQTNNKPQNNQTNTTNKQCNYFHMTERTHIPRRPLLLALEVLLA